MAFVVGDVTAALSLPFLSGAARAILLFVTILIILLLLFLFTRHRTAVWFISTAYLLGTISATVGGIPLKESALATKGAEIQSRFSEYLERLLPEDHNGESAILKALIAGDKSSVDKELKESYRQSGAMHLLALSGLHVGIIYALLSLMLSILGNSHIARRIKCILLLSILWSYAIVTGFGPSIERAVMMITLYETGAFVSGERDMLRAL
ncbi:MAG: ComEC/Rec2 family competence protein, partial [Bacteroidales bacterium]|nr:ComEC/Rec2 family competence protein [Bacteroidales bacterium]